MVVLLWLINKLSPFFTLPGILWLLVEIEGESVDKILGWEKYVGIPLAIAGFVLGFSQWALEVPKRWFWTKSSVELFDNRFFNAVGYAISFFLLPYGISFYIFCCTHI